MSWTLVAAGCEDRWVPDQFVVSLDVEAEPVDCGSGGAAAILRANGLIAWWEGRHGNEEPPRHFHGYFSEARSGPAFHVPDDLPETRGVVTELYAASIFDPAPVEGRRSARQTRAMGISRATHTNKRGPVGTVYATAEDAAEFDLENGKWWDAGWIALLAIHSEDG